MDDFEKRDNQEIYSKKIRAGKRTYFFDVKSTKANDYFITITESKKRFEDPVPPSGRGLPGPGAYNPYD